MPQRHNVTLELHGDTPPRPEHLRALAAHWLESSLPPEAHRAGAKGFSVTPIRPIGPYRYALEVALIDDRFAGSLLAAAERATRWVHLGAMRGRLLPFGHGVTELMASESWEEIRASGRPANVCRLAFLTPAVHRLGSDTVVDADPQWVLGHYRAQWNRFSPETVPFVHFPSLVLTVAHRRLERWLVPTKHGVVPGIVGTLDLDLSANPPELRAAVDALARLAEYTGTGAYTTMGLGVTRRVDL